MTDRRDSEGRPAPRQEQEYEVVEALEKLRDLDRWAKAQARKARSPRVAPETPDPGPGVLKKISQGQPALFLPRRKAETRINESKNPLEKGSFGSIGVVAEVEAATPDLDGTLVMPFKADALGSIVRESLRIFRWDAKAKRFHKVHGSQVGLDGDYVFGRISSPGVYALFGLNAHPLVLKAIRAFCLFGAEFSQATPQLRRDLRDRLCQVILCPPDMRALAADRVAFAEMYRRNAQQGLLLPGGELGPEGIPPPIPPDAGGQAQDICEHCLGLGDHPPPECEIIDEYPRIGGGTGGCSDTGWRSVGPNNISGAILQVVVDPTDSNRIYCAAVNGGIWSLALSLYPCAGWRPLTDQLETLQMRAVAVAPSNGDVLYAASALGGVYRSTDRGRNWARMNTDSIGETRRLLVHNHNPNTLFAATHWGLYYSNDSGASWASQKVGDMLDARMDPQDSSIIYLAQHNQGVFKTYTLGFGAWELILPWASLENPISDWIEIALGYRNSDGTLQNDADRTVVAKLADAVFINRSGGRPSRGGWQSKGRLPCDFGDEYCHGYGTWCHALDVDPFDPDVIAAGQQELFRSHDGGDSWAKVAGFFGPHEDQHCVAFDRTNRNIAYLANDGGVFRSTDGGSDWFDPSETVADAIAARRSLVKDLVTAEFYRVGVQGNHAVGNLYHSGIIATSALSSGHWQGIEGHSWEWSFVFADPMRPTRYYVFHSQLAVRRHPATGSDDFITYGRFKPFTSTDSTSAAVGAIAVDERPGSNVILVGASADDDAGLGYRLMITHQGDRWPRRLADDTVVDLPQWQVAIDNGNDPIVSVAFAPSLAGKAYAISEQGYLWSKDDVGTAGAWVNVGRWAASSVRHMAISPSTDQVIYAMTQNRLARTDNAGADWAEVGSATLPDSEFNAVVTHPSNANLVYLGADSGVYISEDRGDTFSPFDDDLPNAEVLQIFWRGGHLYAVTHGRGLWRRRPC